MTEEVSLRLFLSSLRAEGVAISAGYEIASSSLTSFGIPRNDGRGVIAPFSPVIASRRRGNLRKVKILNPKSEILNNIK